MIYFSTAPVRPDSVEEQQYAALKKFRESCKPRGLYDSFDSTDEFRTKFTRHIAQRMVELTGAGGHLGHLETPTLSEDAELLLKSAARADGKILISKLLKGTTIQVSGERFGDFSPKEAARWKAAVEELDDAGLIEPCNLEGNLFDVTKSGYDYSP